METNQVKKGNSYKGKKLLKIDDINVNEILASEKETYGKKTRLSTLLDIMIMMTLEHYV